MKNICVFALAVLLASALFAQQEDPVIMEIDTVKVHRSEFLTAFLQSQGLSSDAPKTACTYEKRKAITDYAELYLNYRTKLYDAYALGYDQRRSVSRELSTYRKELAQPYLTDSATLSRLLHEAYDRNHYTLHASHILVRCSKHASPSDTMAAFDKAMELYRRVTTGGEDFATVALEYNSKTALPGSGVPNAPVDNGDLGTFTVFDMMYPFESAAYALQVGEVSLPIRTMYGYHIIKLMGKVPFFSRCSIQHIWVSDEKNPDFAAGKIREAYAKIQAGEKFAKVASNYSEDLSSSANGGQLPDMLISELPAEYTEVVAQLNPGDYCAPIHSKYGWHIVRLVSKDALPTFEELEPFYKQKMARDVRTQQTRDEFVAQSKECYGFVDYTQLSQKNKKGKKVAMASLDNARSVLTDSVFRKRWHYHADMVTDTRPLFAVGDSCYNTDLFLRFIEANQKLVREYDLDIYVREKYADFQNFCVTQYVNNRLELDHPDFAAVVKEYRDGLMIFSYNDKMIWSKALLDTAGLQRFYVEQSQRKDIDRPEDSVYFWNTRARVSSYLLREAELPAAKGVKLLQKALDKNRPVEEYADVLRDKMKQDSSLLDSRQDLLEEGNQQLLQPGQWRRGVYVAEGTQSGTYRLVVVNAVLDPCVKALTDARGFYINDYQQYLENSLLEALREKYHVILHQDVLDETTF